MAGSAVLFVGVSAMNLGNYVFNIVMARLLPPVSYGDMVTLFALGMILGVPTLAVVAIIARDVARLRCRGEWGRISQLLSGAMRRLGLAGLALVAVYLLSLPWLVPLLQLSALPTAAYAPMVLLALVVAANLGMLQGLQRFRALSAILSVHTLVKLLVGLAFVLLGYGLLGAVGGVIVSQVVLFALTAVVLRQRLGRRRPASTPADAWRLVTRNNWHVIGGVLLLYLLFHLDIFFVKHYFTPEVAGAFASLSTLGKLILFATASVAMALLPMASEEAEEGGRPRYSLLQAMALVYLPGFALVSVYGFFPELVVGVLFPTYTGSIEPFLGLYGGMSLLLALLNLFVHYFVAIHDYRFVGLLLATNAIAIVLLLVWHQSFFRVIASVTVAGLVGLAGCLLLALKPKRGPA